MGEGEGDEGGWFMKGCGGVESLGDVDMTKGVILKVGISNRP